VRGTGVRGEVVAGEVVAGEAEAVTACNAWMYWLWISIASRLPAAIASAEIDSGFR